MILNKLGTVANEDGGFIYDSATNPLLIPNVFGYNYGMYRPTHMNPATFASFSAASAVAAVVGGKIVPDPMARNWNLSIPNSSVYAVELHGGKTVNVGYICDVMGNDVAYNNPRRKSEVICGELLQIEFDPDLAEKLFGAFSTFLRI